MKAGRHQAGLQGHSGRCGETRESEVIGRSEGTCHGSKDKEAGVREDVTSVRCRG